MGTHTPSEDPWLDIHGYVDLHESHHRFNLQVEAIEAKAKDAVQIAMPPTFVHVQAVQGLQGKWVPKVPPNQTRRSDGFFQAPAAR